MFQQKYQSVSSAASDYRVKCFENYRVYRGAGSRAAGCRSLQPPLPCMTIDSSAAEHFVSGLSAGFVKNRQQAQFEHTHFPSVEFYLRLTFLDPTALPPRHGSNVLIRDPLQYSEFGRRRICVAETF